MILGTDEAEVAAGSEQQLASATAAGADSTSSFTDYDSDSGSLQDPKVTHHIDILHISDTHNLHREHERLYYGEDAGLPN